MTKETLCWKCTKACGGCSWSDHWEHTPVPGWTATRASVKNDDREAWSYLVTECPEFVPEKPRKAEVDMKAWMEAALRAKN